MDSAKNNWRLVVRIHQIVIGLLIAYMLIIDQANKIGLVMLVAAVSLGIQAIVYRLKPGMFNDKMNQHPHGDLKKFEL